MLVILIATIFTAAIGVTNGVLTARKIKEKNEKIELLESIIEKNTLAFKHLNKELEARDDIINSQQKFIIDLSKKLRNKHSVSDINNICKVENIGA